MQDLDARMIVGWIKYPIESSKDPPTKIVASFLAMSMYLVIFSYAASLITGPMNALKSKRNG